MRIPGAVLKKIKYIAGADGISINKEILNLLRARIAEYETEHGKIDLSDLK